MSLGPPKWDFGLNKIWFRYHHTLLWGRFILLGGLSSHHHLQYTWCIIMCSTILQQFLYMRCIASVLGSSWRLHDQAVPMLVYHSVRTWLKTVVLVLGLQEVPLSTLHFSACQRTLCYYPSVHCPYQARLVRRVHRSAQDVWCVFSE